MKYELNTLAPLVNPMIAKSCENARWPTPNPPGEIGRTVINIPIGNIEAIAGSSVNRPLPEPEVNR